MRLSSFQYGKITCQARILYFEEERTRLHLAKKKENRNKRKRSFPIQGQTFT